MQQPEQTTQLEEEWLQRQELQKRHGPQEMGEQFPPKGCSPKNGAQMEEV